jgi:hypothetical protein
MPFSSVYCLFLFFSKSSSSKYDEFSSLSSMGIIGEVKTQFRSCICSCFTHSMSSSPELTDHKMLPVHGLYGVFVKLLWKFKSPPFGGLELKPKWWNIKHQKIKTEKSKFLTCRILGNLQDRESDHGYAIRYQIRKGREEGSLRL